MRHGPAATIAGLLALAAVLVAPPAVLAQQEQQVSANLAAGRSYDEEELHAAPSARDIWALLEHRIPTVISRRLDVGGSKTGTQGLFSARSTSWQENVYVIDGVDVTDPAVRGTAALYFDWDALRSLDASWGSQPAGVATGGVLVDMALRRGGNDWHGAAQGYFSFDGLQADNLSEELAAEGVTVASQIDYLSDASLHAGGPLAGEAVTIFGSYHDRRISQTVAGFDAPVTTSLPLLTFKGNGRWGGNDRLAAFVTRQDYDNPARNAAPLVQPAATLSEQSDSTVIGVRWQHDSGSGPLQHIELGGSFLDIDLPLLLQPDATRQSQLDIVTRVRSGSAPLQIVSDRTRYAGEAQLRLGADIGSVRNDLAAGMQYGYAPTRTAYSAIDDVNIFTSNGAALAAQLLNTPVDSQQNVRSLGLWLHDEVGFAARWSLSWGLRFDDWAGSLPAQTSPGGLYSEPRQYPAQSDVIGWWALSPRVALAFDALGDGRLVIVGAFAQYAHQLSSSTVRYGNANAPGAVTVPWTDSNGDGQFQPGEGGGVTRVTGGPAGQVDTGLSTPLTRELRLGAALELGRRWRARADFWYRKDDNLFDDVEVGLTADDFAEEIVVDPGADNLLGTGDDAGLRVFNQIDDFGGNRLLLTTAPDKEVTYRGVDLSLQRPWAENWTLSAVLTLGYAQGASGKSGLVPGDPGGISDLYSDPNSLTNAGIGGNARPFWDRPYVLKVYGAYELPHGFVLSGMLRSWSGAPIGRILPVPLNQGIVDVWAAPRGAARNPALTTADIRLAKDFTFSGDLRLSLFGDLFNITNAATVTRTHETFPLYGVPAEIIAPFIARFGARIGF